MARIAAAELPDAESVAAYFTEGRDAAASTEGA